MTTQYAVIDGLPTGLTPTAKLFAVASSDTEVTGNTFAITEGANAKGRYVVTITRATVLPAGDYTLRLFLGSVPLAVADRTFLGTDEETATETPQAVELDSSVTDQLQAIEDNTDVSVGYLTTLVGRLTANAATALANLFNMITGSGLSAKFTETALENVPTGGVGGSGDASQATLLEVKAKTDLIGTSTFVAASFAPDSGNTIRLKVGDSPTITFTSTVLDTVPDMTGATIRFGVRRYPSGEQLLSVDTGEVLVATGLQSVRVALTVADTTLLEAASDCLEYRYDVEARYSDGAVRTFQSGLAMVEQDYSGA
jgi:hypothetical protein